jgi:hypothetical protein
MSYDKEEYDECCKQLKSLCEGKKGSSMYLALMNSILNIAYGSGMPPEFLRLMFDAALKSYTERFEDVR